ENPGANPQTLQDAGADVTDADTYVQQNGMCSESLWPYDPTNFDQKPGGAMVKDALKHKIASARLIPIDQNLINSIETTVLGGQPVLIAISVYNSFEGDGPAASGMIPIPKPVSYNDPNDPKVLIW